MGEHRRRAHQQPPEAQETAEKEVREESVHEPHAVHRRRVQNVTEIADIFVVNADTQTEDAAQPVTESASPLNPQAAAHAHRRRAQAAMPEDQTEETAQPVRAQEEAACAQQETPLERKEAQKAVQQSGRMLTGAKKTASAKKMKKKPKKKGGISRGAREWSLAAVVLLGAALEGIRALAGKARQGLAKAAGKLKGRRLPLRAMAMVLLSCVALVSAWQIGSIALRSVRTRRLNDALSERREQLTEAAPQEEEAEVQSSEEPAMVVFDGVAMPVEDALARMNASTPTPELMPVPELTPVPVSGDGAIERRENQVNIVATTKYHRMGGEALPEMAALHADNHDLVAWMEIPDVLDLPVVYRDNSYYLTRDFYKQKNASGTIFLDEDHPFKEKTQNLLLHGHNMKDGTMFGRLAQYLHDDTYLRNHPFIYFDTLWHKEQYVIFAVLEVSLDPTDGRFFNYFTHDTFSTDAEFSAYIRQLQLRSEYAIPIDVEPGDALLTLSTCLEEDRLVIVARRLREGETRSGLRTFIRMATRQ